MIKVITGFYRLTLSSTFVVVHDDDYVDLVEKITVYTHTCSGCAVVAARQLS